MINHARTLLLNRSRAQLACDWEEFVPADFEASALPNWLQVPWDTLFGTNPEPYSLAWRAHQYMTVLHSSEFEAYVYNLDNRLAYQVPLAAITDDLPVTVAVTSPISNEIVLTGTPAALSAEGRLRHFFDITASGTTFDITEKGTQRTSSVTYTVDGSFTTPVVLHDSGLSVSFRTPVVNGSEWTVDTYSVPVWTVKDVVNQLASVNSEYVMNLFLYRDRAPYSFFWKLWNDNRNFTLKLAGFLLTWIYRHDEYRYG